MLPSSGYLVTAHGNEYGTSCTIIDDVKTGKPVILLKQEPDESLYESVPPDHIETVVLDVATFRKIAESVELLCE